MAEECSAAGTTLGQGGTRIIATLRDLGLNIPKRINKKCDKHGAGKPFDYIAEPALLFSYFQRKNFTAIEREQVVKVLGSRDNFSGVGEDFRNKDTMLEIDHRIPVQRQKLLGNVFSDIELSNASDDQIKETYQMLSRKNNLVKDRACSKCISSGSKPNTIGGLLRIDGGEFIVGKNDCSTCFFAFPELYGAPFEKLSCRKTPNENFNAPNKTIQEIE